MEFLFLSLFFFSFFFLIFSFFIVFLFFVYTSKDHSDPAGLPPGSLGWPIVGETLEFFQKARNGTPEKFTMERMKKHCTQAFKTSLLLERIAVFCGPTGNKFLFSNENKLVVSWWPTSVQRIFPSSIINIVGDEAKRTRQLLMTFLKPEALKNYVGIIDAVMQRHMHAEWEGKGDVEVLPLAKMYTFSLACRLSTSIENQDHVSMLEHEFDFLVKGIVRFPLNILGTSYHRTMKAADNIRRELWSIFRKRRVDLERRIVGPTKDMLSYMLVNADEDGRFMTETEVVDNILMMLFAGRDTSSCAITFLMKYLAEMPEVYQGVLREQMEIVASKGTGELHDWEDLQKMKYSWNVLSEAIRLAPPAQGTFKKAMADFTYAGCTIPKGWKLYRTPNSTHKNPDYFPDPEKFDPSRFEGDGPSPYTYMPFGGGPRMCPGKEFARLEILVFLHNVVKRFRWEAMFPNEKITVDPIPVPEKGLPIRLHRHKFLGQHCFYLQI